MVDLSNINYFYGDISFVIYSDFSGSDLSLSIRSYLNNDKTHNFSNMDISNINIFKYSNSCEYIIEGVKTTIPFHQQLLEDKKFLEGDFTTKFMDSFEIK